MVAEADVAVLDMEAGLEHMGRGTVEHVDPLLIVTEPYYRALDAATRIRDLAKELGVPRVLVVANRLRSDHEREAVAQYCRNHDLDLVASIPFDEAIPEAEQLGLAPLDHTPNGPAVEAIRGLSRLLLSNSG
jgi:CO dehydrogenase maturation factor